MPLAQYSDVLYLQYEKLCGRAKPPAQVSSLKYMMDINIENPNTWSIALKALMNKNGGKMDIPEWPGTEFSLNEAEGKALLGTQVGAPLAWLLIQHKEAFGKKSVVKVTCYNGRSSYTNVSLTSSLSTGQGIPQQEHDKP